MSTSVIELNDSEIRVGTGGRIVWRSPGYSFITDNNIEIGEAAASKARLHPRAANNRYWKNLNQDPLPSSSPRARHHADLAYAQLVDIHEHAGKPGNIIFAVPASFSREQLALLLGLVEASPMTAVGLVDSAIAASAALLGRGRYEHLDMQLHQCVLTRIEVGEMVSRESVQVIDNVGLVNIYDQAAHLIADQFIKESRFDPQHHPETEQALYDQIPACFNSLLSHAEVALEVQYQQTQYQAKLPAELLQAKLAPLYEKIKAAINTQCPTIISHQMGRLPGFRASLGNAETLEENSVVQGCLQYQTDICKSGSALSFVSALPAASDARIQAVADTREDSIPTTQNKQDPITHILHQHSAFPINSSGIYLSASGTVNTSASDESHCLLTVNSSSAELSQLGELTVFVNGIQVKQTMSLSAGDIISFVGSKTEYVLIHVSG